MKRRETELDIALNAGNLIGRGVIDGVGDSREFLHVTVPQWAEEFEVAAGNSEDYLAEIDQFSERKLKEEFGHENA